MPPKIPRGNQQIHREEDKMKSLNQKIDKLIEKIITRENKTTNKKTGKKKVGKKTIAK